MSDGAKLPVKQIDVKEPFRLRLWPAVVIVGLLLAAMYIPPLLKLENPLLGFLLMAFAPLVAAPLFAIWWLFFSRVSWLEGFGGLAFAVIAGVATVFIADKSMGIPLQLTALPWAIIICVSWLIISFFLPWSTRKLGLAIAIISTCAFFCLLRFEGVTGEFDSKITYRWEKTSEQKYVENLKSAPKPGATDAEKATVVATEGDWVGFRGPNGDSVYSGPPISEDWSTNPPKQLWKRPIGPGWSSFVVVGNHLITQEQREDKEVIAAYQVDTGEPIWAFEDSARFEESIAGAGPRATPVFRDGKLYAVGAKGNLHCLDAATGSKHWSTSIVSQQHQKKDQDGKPAAVEDPMWGYSSSPVLVGNAVITLPGKPTGDAVTAFDAETGKLLWSVGEGNHSYTSAHLATIAGVPQVLALTSAGLMGISPEDGGILWNHQWSAGEVARCCQPYVQDDSILVSTWGDVGARKVKVEKQGESWKDSVVWENKKFKPYYNDLVVYDGHAYGFDYKLFCCVDLETGKFNWTGGRYGCGQVLLLEKQKKLLILSEQGEAVLLEVNPKKRIEVAKFQAINGKTWNHPVVAHGKLFVRNGEEMACYDVSAGASKTGELKEPVEGH